MSETKFNIWDIVYVSLEWTLAKYLIRGYFYKWDDVNYIVCNRGKDTVIFEKNIFADLEEAKRDTTLFIQGKINELQEAINLIVEAEEIDLVPETMESKN